MRGRNGRKGPNPLTRSYESNGPDVKIRGTAHHIAEKYLQLARDAHSSGDPVMAESYLQHAEHYFRLIAAAQAAQQAAAMGVQRPDDDEIDDDDVPDRFASPAERAPFQPQQNQQQPYAPQGGFNQPQPQGGFPQQERTPYEPRRDRQQHQQRQDRQDRQDRPQQERQERPQQERQDRPQQERQQDRPQAAAGDEAAPEGAPRQDRDRRERYDRGERAPLDQRAQGERTPRQDRGFDRPRDSRPQQPQREPRFGQRDQVPRDQGRDQGPRDSGPRFERAPRETVEDASALPAFIMAPPRAPAPVPALEEAAPAPAPRAVNFETGDDPAMEEARFPLRPRRRRRKPEGETGAAPDAAEERFAEETPAVGD
jgi:hypothetical protein